MSEESKGQEELKVPEETKVPETQITIDPGTAFSLKMQEFDKKIAEAELAVATLKKEKMCFIYDQNVQQIVLIHKEKAIKAQIEEEARKKMSEQTV